MRCEAYVVGVQGSKGWGFNFWRFIVSRLAVFCLLLPPRKMENVSQEQQQVEDLGSETGPLRP